MYGQFRDILVPSFEFFHWMLWSFTEVEKNGQEWQVCSRYIAGTPNASHVYKRTASY